MSSCDDVTSLPRNDIFASIVGLIRVAHPGSSPITHNASQSQSAGLMNHNSVVAKGTEGDKDGRVQGDPVFQPKCAIGI